MNCRNLEETPNRFLKKFRSKSWMNSAEILKKFSDECSELKEFTKELQRNFYSNSEKVVEGTPEKNAGGTAEKFGGKTGRNFWRNSVKITSVTPKEFPEELCRNFLRNY